MVEIQNKYLLLNGSHLGNGKKLLNVHKFYRHNYILLKIFDKKFNITFGYLTF